MPLKLTFRRYLSLIIMINIYIISIRFWVGASQSTVQPVKDSWNFEASPNHRLRRLSYALTLWQRLPPRPPPLTVLAIPPRPTPTAPLQPSLPPPPPSPPPGPSPRRPPPRKLPSPPPPRPPPPPPPPSSPPPQSPSPTPPRPPTTRRRPPYNPQPSGPSLPPSSPSGPRSNPPSPSPPPPKFPPRLPRAPRLPPPSPPPRRLSPSYPLLSTAAMPVQSIDTLSTIAMAVDKCGEASSGSVELLQDLYAGPLPDFFEMASFGAMIMPKDPEINLVVPKKVIIGCSGWSLFLGRAWNATPTTDDNMYGWGDAADSFASKRLWVDIEKFSRRIYLVPFSMGGYAVGTLNCPPREFVMSRVTSSVTSSKAAILKALIHELGHTIGMMHSMAYTKNGTELYSYGDGSCPMGHGGELLSHFNAPQSAAIGWITPQAVVTQQDLSAGVWRSFKVAGLANSPVNSLQVLPATWKAAGWGDNDSIFISFRHAAKGDAALQAPYRNKVQVHKWAPGTDSGGCAPPVLLSNLDATSAPVWPRPGSTAPADTSSPLLVVRVTAVDTLAGVATVGLCRAFQFGPEKGSQCRDGLDNNCDGLVDNC